MLVSGSWNIMAISVPLNFRLSFSFNSVSLVDLYSILPPVIFAGGIASNPMIDSARVDFPQPDSPTTATSVFCPISRSTLSSARRLECFDSYAMERSEILRRPLFSSGTSSEAEVSPRAEFFSKIVTFFSCSLRHQGVLETVAEEAKSDHSQRNNQPWKERKPWIRKHEILVGADHLSPVRVGWPDAEPQVTQPRIDQDDCADVERCVDQ